MEINKEGPNSPIYRDPTYRGSTVLYTVIILHVGLERKFVKYINKKSVILRIVHMYVKFVNRFTLNSFCI